MIKPHAHCGEDPGCAAGKLENEGNEAAHFPRQRKLWGSSLRNTPAGSIPLTGEMTRVLRKQCIFSAYLYWAAYGNGSEQKQYLYHCNMGAIDLDVDFDKEISQ